MIIMETKLLDELQKKKKNMYIMKSQTIRQNVRIV